MVSERFITQHLLSNPILSEKSWDCIRLSTCQWFQRTQIFWDRMIKFRFLRNRNFKTLTIWAFQKNKNDEASIHCSNSRSILTWSRWSLYARAVSYCCCRSLWQKNWRTIVDMQRNLKGHVFARNNRTSYRHFFCLVARAVLNISLNSWQLSQQPWSVAVWNRRIFVHLHRYARQK